jgi:exopolysaccharide biosynthesis polyprenyl glycosylphosphotransferase
MWRQQSVFFRRALLVYDVIVCAAAFLCALFVRDWLASEQARASPVGQILEGLGGVPPGLEVDRYQLVMLGLLPVWALSLSWADTTDFRRTYPMAAWHFAKAVAIGLALFLVGAFLFKLTFVARSFVALFAVIQLGALTCGRVVLMETLRYVRHRGVDGHRVVIVGCGEPAVAFAKHLQRQSPWKIELLGYVSVVGEEAHPQARPQLGHLGSLAALLDRTPVDEVVFAAPDRELQTFREGMSACEARGVDVLFSLPSTVPHRGSMQIANISGFDYPLLNLRRTPTSEPRLAVKRAIDLVGGLVGLLLAGPIMLVAAIAIKVDSKGPIFFKQVRAGRNGRKFTMFKFRSMVVDAEELKARLAHLNEMSGPVFKIKQDPRITKVGRILRKTSIDELPQLFNIVTGDMSLVGPRPPLPSEVEQYEPWQRRRLSVKPGLTGLWQVSGRNQVDFEEWMQLDLDYIDNWSLWLDLKIIARTVPVVLLRSGAS